MGFFNIHSVAKLQKIEGGLLRGKKVYEKSRTVPKKSKGVPFGLVRHCMLRGKPFRFSSLGQRIHFGVFCKFCRTFVELFWSVQVVLKNTDEKP